MRTNNPIPKGHQGAFMKLIRSMLIVGGLVAAFLAFTPTEPRAQSHDVGACIRCEAYGNPETCKRCLDKPDSTKATVPAPCKAAVPDCKARLDGECKPIGNPSQFVSCLGEDKKCQAAVAKCEAWK